jgi:Na+-translocating ferredoxin:NAD+ oxidoreductase RnfG subunit
MKVLYILVFLVASMDAQVLISPQESMKMAFGEDVTLKKKNILLKNKQAKKIQDSAKVKLSTKIYRIFSASKDSKILGYGILVNEKVRSKNAVIMYHILSDSTLNSIEIIAFNEPLEYIPSKTWNEQFNKTKTDKMLRLSRDIPTISGATLSARAITDASRVAFGIYNELLKDK